ncbi:hypothetical protein UFOVP95_33 [uncultured Caudovirales phage]|uniref:Uncharacterized protein n=1 Tax=uncultured Caudovirales phage TaxID=2100421 RepID=A0A6J5L1V2_9CAUD|nr:hypothetical protein UFOVP95_33 [uncultured Caudovirales phage]
MAEMTDNLVKRLRSTTGDACRCGTPVCLEAADRIEKLEAALRDLLDGWECCAVSKAMRRVAREALEGKDE